ncbi:MAG TPA: esterase [Mycobacterium sp.]|nr:esterase [Mycobacterium sp.]
MRILVAATLLAGVVMGGWAGMPSAVAAPSCAELGGVIETAQMCHVHTSTSSYTLDLRFPVDYPDQQGLTDYVVQNRDGFITVVKTSGPRDMPYEMDATAEQQHSGRPPNNTQSVVLKIFQDVGGPQPSTWWKAFNYDLGQHRPITYDTLFAANSKPLEAIYPIVQRELERQTGLPGLFISPGAGLDPSHYQNFAVTNDDLIFYFAPGELLPLSAGATSARVPRNAIPSLVL